MVVQGLVMWVITSAKFFREAGAKVIAIAEYEGAIYNPDGLNEEEVFQHPKENGFYFKFSRSQQPC